MNDPANVKRHPTQLRLMLEEVCSDLCRVEHADRDDFSPQSLRINREQFLGVPGGFADIAVWPRRALTALQP